MLDFQASRWTDRRRGGRSRPATTTRPASRPACSRPPTATSTSPRSGQSLWERFCKAAGCQEFLNDPKFKKGPDRSKNRQELNARIAEYTRKRPSQEWIDLMYEAGVPCGPIYTIDQTFNDPQVKHLRMARPMNSAKVGTVDVVAQPANISGFEKDIRLATPELGQHTDEVLKELGYDDKAIKALHQKGVV